MTIAQQARLVGWNASFAIRGVPVLLHPAGPTFKALVAPVIPSTEEYAISKEVRNASMVSILRSDIASSTIKPGIGSTFINQFTSETYRVVEIEDNGIDIKIGYKCETAAAS